MAKARRTPRWFVYMLECAGDRIYTGIALDVTLRFEKHCAGRGAAFTRINKPVRLMAAMACGSQGDATRAEYALKQLPRSEKLRWALQHRFDALEQLPERTAAGA